jgi:hypothetical protein
MINTNPATLRSGTVWVQIDTTNATNTELYDMSALSFEYDLKASDAIINSIGVSAGTMSITVDDSGSGVSVYDTLLAEIGDSTSNATANISATMHFLKHGETQTKRFPFQVTKTGLSYDIVNDKTTIQLLPRALGTSKNCVNFFADMPANYPQRSFFIDLPVPTNTNLEAYHMGDVIEAYVSTLDSGAGNSNVYRSGFNALSSFFPAPGFGRSVDYTVGGDANTYIGNGLYAFANTHGIITAGRTDPIRAKVISAALMEGAFFGSAFNINFYVNRLSNVQNVSVGNDSIISLKIVRGENQVNAVNVHIQRPAIVSTPSGLGFQYLPFATTNRSNQINGAPEGNQFLGIAPIAHSPQFNRGVYSYDGGYSEPRIFNGAVAQDTPATNTWNTKNLATAGSQVYLQAFTVAPKTPERIEAVIMGVDSIKPYEAIRFDSTTPARLQSAHYRPSSIKYDFKEDTISITAYSIP